MSDTEAVEQLELWPEEQMTHCQNNYNLQELAVPLSALSALHRLRQDFK